MYGKELFMKKFLIPLLLPALLLYADATKETFSRMKMVGGLMSTETRTKAEFRANMKTEDNNVKVTTIISTKPQHLGNITRLDKELLWDINHDGKTYTEGPLLSPKEKVKVETKTEGAPDTVQRYRVVSSEFSVKKLDSTKTVNGFPCTGYLAVWSLTVEEIATKNRSTSTMTMTEWTTPETDVITQAEAEEAAFNKAYIAKLGLNIEPGKAEMMGMGYLMTLGVSEQDYAAKMQGFGTELAKIQGYPIITDVSWAVIDSSKPATQAAEPAREPEKGKFGLPNLSGIISNKIADKVVPKLNEAGTGPVFSAYVEVKSISVGALPDQDFEVPAGYKKK
jgi:hypothetical protein